MEFSKKVEELADRYFVWLMLAALVLALVLRFLLLGSVGLADREADQALQVLSLVKGQATLIGGQPGYIGLTSLLFFLFGGSNFFARFWPAMFGTGLVLVPGLYRKQLDTLTTVLLSFLLAFEPALVALSRTADGTMIVISGLLAAIGFYLHRRMILAGIFLGIAVIGSPNFWSLALIMLLAGVLTFLANHQKAENDEANVPVEKPKWWLLALSAVITLLLISSQFFIHPNGISGIGTGLAGFFRSWRQTGELSPGTFLLVLLITQFPAILLGIWGFISGLKEKQNSARFLGLWWIIGFIFWIINPMLNTQMIALIDLPLFVLAAMQMVRIFRKLAIRSRLVFIIEAVVTFSLILFSILNFLNLLILIPGDAMMIRNRIIGSLLPLALWLAFTMLMSWGWDVPSTQSGLLTGLALMLALLLLGSGWKAAQLGSRPENEFLTENGTVTGKASLLGSLNDQGRWNSGQPYSLDIDISGVNSSSLIWALRDFEKVTLESTFPVNQKPSIVLSNVGAMTYSQTSYRGQLLVWSLEPDFSQMDWQDWFNWLFLRKVPQKSENILLWVRNDLFKDTASQTQPQ